MEPTESQLQPFDDPAFKAAVGRAWGGERCPDAVRNRVLAAQASDSETVDESPSVIGRIRPSLWRKPLLR
jgi:hypothetical protein